MEKTICRDNWEKDRKPDLKNDRKKDREEDRGSDRAKIRRISLDCVEK
ncbi:MULTISPECIES: hypothetical protein [unclassified Gilliamella]|nr:MULTISPECIES: hypothetical protein [unclassified Gilliamella]MCX8585075.1 hypothetical protein [Gilliamella sp. B3562]MCX8684722.1 hypothetical protein [Gilliamella sp. B2864]